MIYKWIKKLNGAKLEWKKNKKEKIYALVVSPDRKSNKFWNADPFILIIILKPHNYVLVHFALTHKELENNKVIT